MPGGETSRDLPESKLMFAMVNLRKRQVTQEGHALPIQALLPRHNARQSSVLCCMFAAVCETAVCERRKLDHPPTHPPTRSTHRNTVCVQTKLSRRPPHACTSNSKNVLQARTIGKSGFRAGPRLASQDVVGVKQACFEGRSLGCARAGFSCLQT